MNKSVVITIRGEDRPGLVESVAALVAKHGGNWEESRMCRLGGQFAGILLATIPTPSETAFQSELLALDGLTITVGHTSPPPQLDFPHLVSLGIVGQDRPGIVSQITEVLARHAVNVEDLHTECTSAPMTGESLFSAEATISIPGSCNIESLRTDLEKIASDLMVDLAFDK